MTWVIRLVGGSWSWCVVAGFALAQEPEVEAVAPASSQNAFVLGGYVEAFYQKSFNRPGNGITHYRGFDNRHNSFTLSNIGATSWF